MKTWGGGWRIAGEMMAQQLFQALSSIPSSHMVAHKDDDFLPKLNLNLLTGWKQDCRENKTPEANKVLKYKG